RLLAFGTNEPGAFGVRSEPVSPSDWKEAPRPGAYVVSAHWLVHGLYMARTQGTHSDWLARHQPVRVVRGGLSLFRLPHAGAAGPEPPGAEASRDAGGSRGR